MAEVSPRHLSDELSGNLMPVTECFFHRTEPFALFVVQYASGVMRAIDRFDQHVTGPELPDFNSIPDALVLAGLHVLLVAAHVRLVLAPDWPIVFEPPLDVNPPLKCGSERLRGLEPNHV